MGEVKFDAKISVVVSSRVTSHKQWRKFPLESSGACNRQLSTAIREFRAPEYRSGQELSQRAFSNSHASSQQPVPDFPNVGAGFAGEASGDENAKRVVFLTAGAAGMYCGSCMHDNALARELRIQGVDCLLQPVYTPIRTDALSVADSRVFFGGIHIYLLQRIPWLKHVPASIRRTLDWSPLIRLATRRTHATDANQLGQLAISMLRGAEGRQAQEVARLTDWLADQVQPHALVLSNLLIGGALPSIRKRLPNTRLVVVLQGDDIFLDHLPNQARAEAIRLCQNLVPSVDRFVVNSQFYAAKMGQLLNIPSEQFEIAPLSIDVTPFAMTNDSASQDGTTAKHSSSSLFDRAESDDSFRLGYMARIAPEKGFHHLVDSFIRLASKADHADLTLHASGWLGKSNQAYFQDQQHKLETAGLTDRFTYHGSPDLTQKVSFLKSLDLFSVPTDYHDPKGLFVLEALAAGVPVIQPDHGAFGELLGSTGGGLLIKPGCLEGLCAAIEELKQDEQRRLLLGVSGQQQVMERHAMEQAVTQLKTILFN
ncbi:glycosyltransferase family 4 protein [Rhodopirellula sp.]|nr:glycosyltransferase family 4 protein [Rhodopirellula sp.]